MNPVSDPSPLQLGIAARAAANVLRHAATADKQRALQVAADDLVQRTTDILAANRIDLATARHAGRSEPMLDRLRLDASRIEDMANGVREIARLADPVGAVMATWTRPNGLRIERVRTPLGVIGVIYESRPNVTADAGALCLMSGNAVILRGGSDARKSAGAIHQSLLTGLQSAGLPAEAIQRVASTDRAVVGQLLAGLDGHLDVIVPRGGRGLVERVQRESRVPVFAHLEGICHVFVDAAAELEMAVAVVANSKMRRPGICGAAETLLIDRSCVATHLRPITERLLELGCELRGDKEVCREVTTAIAATEQDWSTEYLAPVLAIRIVDGLDQALEHIATYSSGHTESIVTANAQTAEKFLSHVDSAIVLHNASTQFADGREFGMGAEIGIATGKFHARGPVGVEQLTTFHYRVHGAGQLRS